MVAVAPIVIPASPAISGTAKGKALLFRGFEIAVSTSSSESLSESSLKSVSEASW